MCKTVAETFGCASDDCTAGEVYSGGEGSGGTCHECALRGLSASAPCGAAIREAGMQPAVTINPATPVSLLKDIINDVYMVLIMSVNPGFGGQKFIEHSLDKVRELRELITVTGSQA